MIRVLPLAVLAGFLPAAVAAQEAPCRFICELEWKLEPTVTIEHLANRHRVVTPDGVTERVDRERVFETVLALAYVGSQARRRCHARLASQESRAQRGRR
jgi:hypothetical protein